MMNILNVTIRFTTWRLPDATSMEAQRAEAITVPTEVPRTTQMPIDKLIDEATKYMQTTEFKDRITALARKQATEKGVIFGEDTATNPGKVCLQPFSLLYPKAIIEIDGSIVQLDWSE